MPGRGAEREKEGFEIFRRVLKNFLLTCGKLWTFARFYGKVKLDGKKALFPRGKDITAKHAEV